MAKTKAVKQAEAIIRNKSSFEQHLRWYKDNIPGGNMYAHNRLIYGIEEAKTEEARAEKKMLDAAARANIDRDGNTIVKSVLAEKRITKRSAYREDVLNMHGVPESDAKLDVEQDLQTHMFYNGY